jgi:hypothetical protein
VNNAGTFSSANFPGEGVLMYPGADVGIQGAAPSIRLKWLRDGIEDFDYVQLLKTAGQATWALQIARGVGSDWTNWTRDPNAIESARQQLGQELHRLSVQGGTQMYSLTVSGGTGSGSYAAGASVPISAANVPEKIFDQWVGSIAGVQNVYSPSTILTMPASAATITAAYKTATTSPGVRVLSFTLINSDTNLPIAGFDPIAPGAKLNLRTLPTRNLNIRANTDPVVCGSVYFQYTGGNRLENGGPYAMAGDASGDYANWTPALGTFQVSATAYTGVNRTGTASTTITISMAIVDEAPSTTDLTPRVVSLTLIDAVTNRPVSGFDPIQSGAVVDRAALGVQHLNVRANIGTAPVGSIYFSGNFGFTKVENSAPFAMAGDTNGDYMNWTPAAGLYTISATPYSGASRSGSPGTTLTVMLTVR